jgi:hypothetical protein
MAKLIAELVKKIPVFKRTQLIVFLQELATVTCAEPHGCNLHIHTYFVLDLIESLLLKIHYLTVNGFRYTFYCKSLSNSYRQTSYVIREEHKNILFIFLSAK